MIISCKGFGTLLINDDQGESFETVYIRRDMKQSFLHPFPVLFRSYRCLLITIVRAQVDDHGPELTAPDPSRNSIFLTLDFNPRPSVRVCKHAP